MDSTTELGIPNLDCMDVDDVAEFLERFPSTTGHPGLRIARELVPDRRAGYVRIAMDLRNYGWNKLTAMRCRLAGKIDVAMMYEGICDRIYAGLPSDLRW